MISKEFNRKIEKIIANKKKEKLDNPKSMGSQVLLFLEHYQRLANYAQKLNYQQMWLNDYTYFIKMPNFIDLINDVKLKLYLESICLSSFESNFLNWEFHKERLSELLGWSLEELINPHEPMLFFYDRGGIATYSNGLGFSLRGHVIKKPKIEDLVHLPLFIALEDAAFEKADKEYNENVEMFMKKVPHKYLAFSHGYWQLNVGH